MLNVVRRSQIVGLMAFDRSTASPLSQVEEVWLDETGRIAYFSDGMEYLPLEQVSSVGTEAIVTYGRLTVDTPTNLRRLYQLAVQSTQGEPLGWVEDFLFDWQTGEIVAYILGGEAAIPFGGRAVLSPEDVQEIAMSQAIVRAETKDRLQSESEGLKGLLSEKSQQVRKLVKTMGDRLHDLISPHEHPEVVRVKIKTVSDELASSGEHDRVTLKEATDFLHEQWHHLQQNISRAGSRTKAALDSAWRQLTGKT
ncbi:PRC-barrel domain-containing protein [Chroococcidiopsis sp.]|uniref:PRC-barrel domain-containing protein n=1 Tax=Chroococcidiopsis sp. TaxID=3088168 RepID=UPI003F3F134A